MLIKNIVNNFTVLKEFIKIIIYDRFINKSLLTDLLTKVLNIVTFSVWFLFKEIQLKFVFQKCQ